jgi:hypothetical protein
VIAGIGKQVGDPARGMAFHNALARFEEEAGSIQGPGG